MISPARRAAFDATLAVDSGRLDLSAALATARDSLADPRDRALATDIAVGTQRWRGRLDFLLEQATGRALARLDLEVLAVLRLSVYQLRFLTRVPASAVVNDAVQLVRVARKRSATGLVNAVLRRVATEPSELPAPPFADPGSSAWHAQAIAYLSVTGSHPAWLVERWLARYGWEATAAWVAFNNTTPPVTLWPAPGTPALTVTPPDVPTSWLPGGVVVGDGATALEPMQTGRAFAQDEASAAVGAVAAAVATPPVYDACAAPGGKTLVLATRLGDGPLLASGDLRTTRLHTLRRLLQRVGVARVPLVQADARALPFASSLGTLLIDAPCSGLGTVRRDPDVRWRRQPGDLPELAATQRAMLAEGLRAVGPGGHVVYATCSSEPDENEDVVTAAVAAGGCRLVPLGTLALPGRLPEAVTTDGWLRTTPPAHGLESFFAAVLERTGAPGQVESSP